MKCSPGSAPLLVGGDSAGGGTALSLILVLKSGAGWTPQGADLGSPPYSTATGDWLGDCTAHVSSKSSKQCGVQPTKMGICCVNQRLWTINYYGTVVIFLFRALPLRGWQGPDSVFLILTLLDEIECDACS